MCRGREQPVSGAPGLVRLRKCELYRVRLRICAPYRAELLHPLENQVTGPVVEGVVLVKVDVGTRGLLG